MVLGDKLKQLEELQKLAGPSMEKVFNALWPEEEIPAMLFELS